MLYSGNELDFKDLAKKERTLFDISTSARGLQFF